MPLQGKEGRINRKRLPESRPHRNHRHPEHQADLTDLGRTSRKRNVNRCYIEKIGFNQEVAGKLYWDLKPLAVYPLTSHRMSEPVRKRIHSSDSDEDRGVTAAAENGARCCELLDLDAESSETSQGSHEESRECEILRQKLVSDMFKLCRLSQAKSPLKIVRASQQYMYDDSNAEYLDCINSVAHVGHCHPVVVDALSYALSSNVAVCGWEIDRGNLQYTTRLKQTFPSNYDTVLFCNSGSEAVDLSVQIARLYTCGTDVVVVDNAFHGSLDSVFPLSRKVSREEVEWVHVVPLPDLYRGVYQSDDPDAVDKYLTDTHEQLNKVQRNGKKIACFVAEPMLTIPGIIIPPSTWLQEMYKMVRECGGLCIADEVQTGLGRVGSHFWSFLAQDVAPDIIIIGKPLGNGYPMAAVVTSRDIAAVLGDRIKEYQCTTAMDAIGCAVLDITEQNQLMNMAASVGEFLLDQLNNLKKKYEYIGDVRGKGLVFGIEIVWSKRSKKPSRDIAEQIVHRMKEENVLLANEGFHRNILMLIPPMCFSAENALALTQKLDKVLAELPTTNIVKDLVTGLPTISVESETRDVRLGIFQPQEEEEDDNLSSVQDNMDLQYAQHCYQDLD
ncbi:5-phosphohydroxy-L-lysine phospho-lyase-like isoform X2 [Macrobrachium nipponense]|uniref:5-phosphohydroxy-L-lysine phospho-lyase-like isoform X2 n=1 Tax=Macrobrachium nipponense TaxID=159736 RepID=UPI0030C89B06